MALRFRRSIKLFPGVRLTLGKHGVGLSAGVRGMHVGVNSRGKAYASAGIPGTGLSVTKYAKGSKRAKTSKVPGKTREISGESREPDEATTTPRFRNAPMVGVALVTGGLIVIILIAAMR